MNTEIRLLWHTQLGDTAGSSWLPDTDQNGRWLDELRIVNNLAYRPEAHTIEVREQLVCSPS